MTTKFIASSTKRATFIDDVYVLSTIVERYRYNEFEPDDSITLSTELNATHVSSSSSVESWSGCAIPSSVELADDNGHTVAKLHAEYVEDVLAILNAQVEPTDPSHSPAKAADTPVADKPTATEAGSALDAATAALDVPAENESSLAAPSVLEAAPVLAESKAEASLKFVPEPATVLLALGNPEGWYIYKSLLGHCFVGYRVLVVEGSVVLHQYVRVSLDYATLQDLQAALSGASAYADLCLSEYYVKQSRPSVPWLNALNDAEQHKAVQLQKLCRWATPAEVQLFVQGYPVGVPFASEVAA